MRRTEKNDGCRKFHELCALAQADSLSVTERLDLERHLLICESCRGVDAACSAVGREGMSLLGATYDLPEEAALWDSEPARQRLFASIRDQGPRRVLSFKTDSTRQDSAKRPAILTNRWAFGLLAACMTAAVALSAFRFGESRHPVPQSSPSIIALSRTPSASAEHAPASAQQSSVGLLAAQAARISDLEDKIDQAQKELAQMRAQSSVAEDRVSQLGSISNQREAELQQRTAERDKLAAQLAESETAYQNLQADLVNLRSQHEQSLLHTASLESKVSELSNAAHDQDRRLKDDEQFLVSDRDIRELMGARKLYIADVFDVDSGSRTRKPFGRVFYTQDKSLVFYAFDLDHQPGVKSASAFQVWGQRDSESNTEAHPMNLGILYMDSESNRRWVLRYDDPKQLAEIDAVFVTVEPHGGSQKPTGKPLLYALLRKEANHP